MNQFCIRCGHLTGGAWKICPKCEAKEFGAELERMIEEFFTEPLEEGKGNVCHSQLQD